MHSRALLPALAIAGIVPLAIQAATLTGNINGGDPVGQGNYTVFDTPRPVQHISANDLASDFNFRFDYLLIAAMYPDWVVSMGTDASGTFNVLQYSPFIVNNVGGTNFSA